MLKVSFYSYKGGAGRSTTSWNTIQRLVEIMQPTEQNPFVIVDTDTESAGSTFLYKAKDTFWGDRPGMPPSVQKRMTLKDSTNYAKASDETKKAFFNNMHPVGGYFGLEAKRAVLLIGANLDRKSATEKADTTGKNVGQLENFTNNIKFACEDCGAKALFFDTPAGTQALAERSIEDSDIVVCCMRPTSQFREGTKDQLLAFVKRDFYDGDPKTYILTPTAVCVDEGQKFDGDIYPETGKKQILRYFSEDNLESEEEKIKKAFKNNVKLDMLMPEGDRVFGIPEVARFKWSEKCLGTVDKNELTTSDKLALTRYDVLAQTILKYYEG